MLFPNRSTRAARTLACAIVLVAAAFIGVVHATSIFVPHDFVNGTTADADEVNENFDTLVTESNDQDTRINSLESSVVHTHAGTDITSQVDDADTVDGVSASELEESAEIDADIAAHAAVAPAHHTRYNDPEAVAAMGTQDNSNALNHDRYTDVEALAAADGVNAGTLDGLDSIDFSAASHTHPGASSKLAIVALSGGAYTDPKAAMDDLATWCGTPGAANPCLVLILPGIYDLGNNALTMQSYVDVEGSGENTTTITSTHSSTVGNATSATLVGANFAEVRFLTVENQGGSTESIAIYNTSASPKITHVTATAFGGGTNRGIYNETSSSPIMTNVVAIASGSTNYGIYNSTFSSPIMTNVTAMGSGGTSNNGVLNSESTAIMTNVTATGSGGTESFGVRNSQSSPIMTNVRASASGTGFNYGVRGASSSPIMTNVTATATGGAASYGVHNFASPSFPVMTNVTGTATGGVLNYGMHNSSAAAPTAKGCSFSGSTNSIFNQGSSTAKVAATLLNGSVSGTGFTCVGVYDTSFVALSTSCL